ncbi:MAG: adenosylcobinamide-GDP ribazoletransferase [Desulfurococcales archaeon]|nr:adenosylcobinamide-GDP ribazoletransferase [Desulfurococcales archaeon]
MGLRDLLAFMTRLPVGPGSLEGAARSLHLAPLVGLLEGLVVAGVLHALAGVDRLLAASTALAAHLALTGGLHMDGFSDYAEALAAGARGEAAERILGDARRGSYAIAWTTVLLLARFSLLACLAGEPAAVVASYVAAAESLYAYIALSRGRPQGLGGLFMTYAKDRKRATTNIVALLAAIIPLALLGLGILAIAPLLVAAIVSWLAAWDSYRRLGRPSGDAAGFTYEATLTLALLALAPALC